MKLSIVTPCLNASDFLVRALRSVADQQDVTVEHIVQDGGSSDGTLDILQAEHGIVWESEPDSGMYDALNRGFDRAAGEIFGHLNADEQYLTGALQEVSAYFDAHPDVDVLIANVLVIHPDGDLVCFQKPILPDRLQVMLSHLPTYTVGTFFRRKVWEDGVRFNSGYRALGDSYWMLEVISRGYSFGYLDKYIGAVTQTDVNLSLSEIAREESQALFDQVGRLRHVLWFLQFIRYRIVKFCSGCYHQGALTYAVHLGETASFRHTFRIPRPSPFWYAMRRLKKYSYFKGDFRG